MIHFLMAPNSIKFDAKYISNTLLLHPLFTSYIQVSKALKFSYLNNDSYMR